jgi:DNA-directed RNA polymerase subunit K/omega
MANFTKYEKARIIGARALQISMNAPILIDRGNEMSAIEIAKREFEAGILPITVKRLIPEKRTTIVRDMVQPEGEENKNTES